MVVDSGSAAQQMLGVLLTKKALPSSIVALLLVTGAAHANHQAYYQCGKELIFVNMGKGFTDYELIIDKADRRPLPSRFFRWNDYNGILYYHGRKCQWREWP